MKNKSKAYYTNRYKDIFTFTYDKKRNTILWEGSFQYVRYGWEDGVSPKDNKFNMVDPSGGPYISAGMQSNLIMEDLKGFYVDYLSANDDVDGELRSFNIHLKPLDK